MQHLKLLKRYKNECGIVVGFEVYVQETKQKRNIPLDEVIQVLKSSSNYTIVNAILMKNGEIRGKNCVIETVEVPKVRVQLAQSIESSPIRIELKSKTETRTTKGMLSKGWYWINGGSYSGLYLVKGNSSDNYTYGFEPYSEVLASRLLKALGFDVVLYSLMDAALFKEIRVTDIRHVSVCKSYMNEDTNYTPFSEFVDAREGAILSDTRYLTWLIQHEDLLPLEYVLKMLIGDAFVGNEDRHLNNWDVGENKNGLCYPPVIDFGASLLAWKGDKELSAVIKASNTAYGPDSCKPFAQTHSKQLWAIKKIIAKKGLSIKIPRNYRSIVEDVLAKSDDVFSCLDKERQAAIKNYIYLRMKYLELFV